MYKRALFAVDFDEVGIKAAHKAKAVADKLGAEFYLVHVVEFFPAYAYPGFAGFVEVEGPLKDHAEQEMHKLADLFGLPRDHLFLEVGTTKEEVLSVAEEIQADLLITGSHSKHGLVGLFTSTSSALTLASNCDILVVHVE